MPDEFPRREGSLARLDGERASLVTALAMAAATAGGPDPWRSAT